MSNFDRRYCDAEVRALTQEEDGKCYTTLSGYAALFDSPTVLRPGVVEVIRRGAFDDVLASMPDVRALFNHDSNIVLGRTKSGTLRLTVDDIGLRYEIDLPDTQAAEDLAKSVARGDVSQSSFAFSVAKDGDKWSTQKQPDGSLANQREIVKVAALVDVSPVTYAAYESTSVSARTLESLSAYETSFAAGGAAEREKRERTLALYGHIITLKTEE